MFPKIWATHNGTVDYCLTYVTKQAIAKGRNNTVPDNCIIDAIEAGGK